MSWPCLQGSARVAGGRSGFQLVPTHPEPSVAAAPRGHTCATSERVDRVGGFLVMVADPLTSAPEMHHIGRRSRPLWLLFSETPLSTLFFASDRIPASAVPIWCIYHRQKAPIATIEGWALLTLASEQRSPQRAPAPRHLWRV
jgi:hypothetical protein